MKTSDKGVALIKAHEGFVPHAYRCPAGIWTIGYGHTSGVKPGDVITEAQGDAFLRSDIASAERAVNAAGLKLTQNQFDALVSFVFNVGTGNFNRSTLLKYAKANTNDPRIRQEFSKWIYGDRKVLPGLIKRRKAEADLYFS
ncbi:lysozyme [Porphyromonadaceae bacterium KHP3R9]|nr:lysozyme [Porphyromonadaceae bacterium KHP3R9]